MNHLSLSGFKSGVVCSENRDYITSVTINGMATHDYSQIINIGVNDVELSSVFTVFGCIAGENKAGAIISYCNISCIAVSCWQTGGIACINSGSIYNCTIQFFMIKNAFINSTTNIGGITASNTSNSYIYNNSFAYFYVFFPDAGGNENQKPTVGGIIGCDANNSTTYVHDNIFNETFLVYRIINNAFEFLTLEQSTYVKSNIGRHAS